MAEEIDSYDALARHYDTLTDDYAYDDWITRIDAVVRGHGVRGTTALDVGCGTGNAFAPLARLGYDVVGVDCSEAMLARAAAKHPDVELLQHDMRELPHLGSFAVVLCLDDVLNHLLTAGDLARAMAGLAKHCGEDGVVIWDVNTLAMYRTEFAAGQMLERDDVVLFVQGQTHGMASGVAGTVSVHAFEQRDGVWHRSVSRHRTRHWPDGLIRSTAEHAGLEVIARLGQSFGARLDETCDDERHTKALYVGRRRPKEVT